MKSTNQRGIRGLFGLEVLITALLAFTTGEIHQGLRAQGIGRGNLWQGETDVSPTSLSYLYIHILL